MSNPLVSIITPCYNGAKVMHRLLDSILAQTYKNIEFILVNDGSTDESEAIWYSYVDKFDEAGIKHIYVYQKNQGLGAAINSGLKIFTGDYLCWPDIDDYLEPASIEKRLIFLESHLDYGSVSSDANIFNENDLINPIDRAAGWMTHKYDEWQFKWMLLGQSLYCPGCHMLRTSSFLDVNPNRYIYPARRGQNNQMLLPIYYKYKHGFIDEPLYNYIIYKKSMSTPDTTKEQALDRENEYSKILKWCIEQINMDKKSKEDCYNIIYQNTWNRMSKVFYTYGDPISFLILYFKLKIYKTDMKYEIKNIYKAIKNFF